MLGIIFATIDEAGYFLKKSNAEKIGENLYQAFIRNKQIFIAICGMGSANATAVCSNLINKHKVKIIVNAGAAGALKSGIKIGDCYSIKYVSAIHKSPLSNEKIIPESNSKQKVILVKQFPGMDTASLITLDEGLFDSDKKRQLSEIADLVDMEGRGIVQVCSQNNVECYLIKYVTDYAETDGRERLHKNLESASRVLAEILFQKTNELLMPFENIVTRFSRFTRLEHTLFSFPLLIAGAKLGSDSLDLFKLLLIFVVGFGARLFGMTLNRIMDREIDSLNSRTWRRELPSGAISTIHSYIIAVIGLVFYFGGCYFLGGLCIKLSLVPIIPLAVYSLLKRFTSLCHFGIGLCLALAPAGAYVAMTNSLPLSMNIILFINFTFFWISGFDIIYALQDVESDRRIKVKSLPADYGEKMAIFIAALTHTISLLSLLVLSMQLGNTTASAIALFITALSFAAGYSNKLPLPVRFFPISAIASGAGSLVVLL